MPVQLVLPDSRIAALPKVLYYPAKYRRIKSIGQVLEYYVYNESSGCLKRHFVKLNCVRKKFATHKEFMEHVHQLASAINIRLQQETYLQYVGASVRSEQPADKPVVRRPTSSIKSILDKYMSEKSKELRPDSLRSYSSFTSIFSSWLKKRSITSLEQIDASVAVDFMDYVYNERNVSIVSYNNYLKLARTLFAWLLERCLVDSNYFERIKKKVDVKEKKRILISREDREKILSATNIHAHYATLCMLVYSSLVRPAEIRKIQLKHIHIKEGYIEIPGENAKNHHTRRALLTPQLIERLLLMRLDRYPEDYYLFGSYIEPAKKIASTTTYRSYFDKVRTKLSLPSEYTLYSFRDTGITDMLTAGIPNIDVMKLADHHSLDVTTVYTRHSDNSLITRLQSKAPTF